VLIVDAASDRIVEANPAAIQLLQAAAGRRLVGRALMEIFATQNAPDVAGLLTKVLSTGRGEELRTRLAVGGRQELLMSASLFRQHDAASFLIRLRPLDVARAVSGAPQQASRLLEVLEASPDGLVVTSPEGLILSANRAFLELARLPTVEQARGQPLDRWLGNDGVSMRVLIGRLRRHGSVRLFATSLRDELGSISDVEVSAVAALTGEEPCLGFTVRSVQKIATTVESGKPRELPRAASELASLVGRMTLKDVVRETTDVIERLCIEAALEITGDNRATAAEMLGLSRQTLYAKLHRHGLVDLPPSEELE
jgi:transcriptional regulator PpsR